MFQINSTKLIPLFYHLWTSANKNINRMKKANGVSFNRFSTLIFGIFSQTKPFWICISLRKFDWFFRYKKEFHEMRCLLSHSKFTNYKENQSRIWLFHLLTWLSSLYTSHNLSRSLSLFSVCRMLIWFHIFPRHFQTQLNSHGGERMHNLQTIQFLFYISKFITNRIFHANFSHFM